MNQKNVIIITLDECKYSAMSVYGNPYVMTPAAEYAAKNGAMFEHSYVCHPKCVPSRSALMTGRYVHTNGHRTLPGFEIKGSETNLAGLLKEKGYVTGMFGKNHTVEEAVKSDFFDEFTKDDGEDPLKKNRDRTLYLDDLMWRAFYRGDWDRIHDEAPEDVQHVEDSLNFIRTHQKDSFFMLVNLNLPHPVYYGMSPFIDKIRKMKPQLPVIESLENASNHLRMYRQTYGVEELGEEERREIEAAYYSMVSYVDHLVFKIYQEVEKLKLKEETIIVYTSDHGDFAGEHGSYEKYDTFFYDCLVRVPLFIQCPGLIQPCRLTSMIENVDIFPTILELLGMETPRKCHGKSALSYIKGEKAEHKPIVFAEGGIEQEVIERAPHYDSSECERMKPNYYLKQKVLVDFPLSMQKAKMVRTKEWKMIYRQDGEVELYDMLKDPGELKNLGRSRPEVMHHLMEELLKWSMRTETDEPHIENLYA